MEKSFSSESGCEKSIDNSSENSARRSVSCAKAAETANIIKRKIPENLSIRVYPERCCGKLFGS